MTNVKNDKKPNITEWSTLAELRFVEGSVVDRSAKIQTEFDFTEAKFFERHSARPHRAIIRAEKEAELLAAWEHDNGTMLRAPWRAGKTELVFAAIENANLHDRFLFVNSQDSPYPALRWREVDDFRKSYGVREVIDHVVGIRQRLGEEVARYEIATALDKHIEAGGNPFTFVGNLRREMNLPPALVAFDEIADYAYDAAQLAFLASVADIEGIRLCLIVQRAPSIEPKYEVAFPDFHSVYLSPLTIGESAQIVRAKARDAELSFSLHGIVEIHRAAGGRPLEVSAIVDACRQATEAGKHGPYYERSDVDKLVRGEIVHLTMTALEPLIVNHIRVYERGVSATEQALLDRLVKSSRGEVITPETKAVVEGLARYGIVAVSGDRVHINGELFRDVVKKRMTDYRTHNYWQPDEYGNDYV